MSNEKDVKQPSDLEAEIKIFPATVVAVNDRYAVVINRGYSHGIKKGQNFLIYGLSEKEIIDPETGESLGYLEIVRGTGSVIHLQEKMATIESNKRSANRVIRRKPASFLYSGMEETETVDSLIALDDPETGDKARPI